jgi:hypothetical protein
VYEVFCDQSYYDLWCVRSVNDKRFDSPMSFHFMREQDAREFLRLITLAQ